AVGFREGLAGILQFALAIAEGDEVAAVDAVFVDQILLDRIGPALGQALIIFFAARRIGVAGDHEGRALQFRIGQRAAQRLNRRDRLGADIGRVVVEGDLQIDLRLVLDDGRDFLAFGLRQRAGGAAADAGGVLGLGGT